MQVQLDCSWHCCQEDWVGSSPGLGWAQQLIPVQAAVSMSVIFWFKWGLWHQQGQKGEWCMHRARGCRNPAAVHHSHPGDGATAERWTNAAVIFCQKWPIRASSHLLSVSRCRVFSSLVALVFLCSWVPKRQRGAQPSVFVKKLGILGPVLILSYINKAKQDKLYH